MSFTPADFVRGWTVDAMAFSDGTLIEYPTPKMCACVAEKYGANRQENDNDDHRIP